jgi:glutaconate CoA-transferase subunit A
VVKGASDLSDRHRPDKRMTAAAAVRAFLHDGDVVCVAGFSHLIPYALGHEVIRQARRGLTLAKHAPDLLAEQLLSAGCIQKLVFSWHGNPGLGNVALFRRAVEGGTLAIEEYTHLGLTARLYAGASGMTFYPVATNLGSDLPEANPQIRSVTCPYTGIRVSVVPPLNPDVSLVHVQRADPAGNAHAWGILGDLKEAAFAARRVIVSAEEIVDPAVIRSDPNRTVFPGFIVDAVVEAPLGAHPSYAHGYYDRDNVFYREWDRNCGSLEAVRAYLDEWVYGVPDRAAYGERLPAEVRRRITVATRLSVPAAFTTYRG